MLRFALVVLLLAAPSALASTPVSGSIVSNEIWTPEGSPYQATGPITLSSGVTLTLEPGTVVEFDATSFLLVNGMLLAQGTPEDPVVLKASPGETSWYGILYHDNAGPPVVDGAGDYLSGPILEHVEIRNGGVDAIAIAGITLNGGAPYLRNVSFTDGGGAAIDGTLDPGSTLHVVECSFSGHDFRAIDVSGSGTVRVVGSTFADNIPGAIRVIGGTGHRILDTLIENPDPAPGPTRFGIQVEDASDVEIRGSEVRYLGTSNALHRGILLSNVAGAVVADNSLRRCARAIEVAGSGLEVRGNECRDGQSGAAVAQIHAYGNPLDSPGALVEDNVIENGDGTGITVHNLLGPVVRGNLVRGAFSTAMSVNAPVAGGATVENNLLLDGTGTGLRVNAYGPGVVIRGNTVQGFAGIGFFAAGVGNQATPALVEDNVITHNGARGARLGGGALVFRGNDLSHNVTGGDVQTGTGPGEGNLVYISPGASADFAGDGGAGVYNRLLDDTPGAADEYAVFNESPNPVDLTLVCWGTQGPTVIDEAGSSSTTAPVADCALLGIPGDADPGPPPLAVRPNPMRNAGTVSFHLDTQGPVDVRVFDIAGRQVARLVEGIRPAGLQEVAWDGRAADGRPAAAGVYLVRLRTAEGVATQRIVRLAP